MERINIFVEKNTNKKTNNSEKRHFFGIFK